GMRASPLLFGAIAIMLLGGVGDGVINLVAPLQLGDLGLSSGEIGAWFSVASTIFIASSLAVARLGRRAVSLRLAGLMAALQAVALVPVLLSGAVAPVILTVLVRSAAVGPPYAMAFPLGALGAGRLGRSRRLRAPGRLVPVDRGGAGAGGPSRGRRRRRAVTADPR